MLYKYSELTQLIIGAAMRVHSEMGNGFQELIFQRSLAIEFRTSKIEFERELSMPVYYKGNKVGERRVDFFVQKTVMVEIKAVINLEHVHLAQARNYLEAYNMEVGLLINFGAPSLQYKRIWNNKYVAENHPGNPQIR
jgi:GxxExxY protein